MAQACAKDELVAHPGFDAKPEADTPHIEELVCRGRIALLPRIDVQRGIELVAQRHQPRGLDEGDALDVAYARQPDAREAEASELPRHTAVELPNLGRVVPGQVQCVAAEVKFSLRAETFTVGAGAEHQTAALRRRAMLDHRAAAQRRAVDRGGAVGLAKDVVVVAHVLLQLQVPSERRIRLGGMPRARQQTDRERQQHRPALEGMAARGRHRATAQRN
jgi:hypothetical protein